ncbi:hypothetical protein BOTBODRAFT_169773 [Botryobasidium botryosum FD-172 SS1]|uniref:uS12 prolyl 3,4-dihydroxylase n=1 Tax=Botryobasidium botryosum (strain FD-172 SS1) TaxID=930990 RepID=A0A067MZE1_BOTB1|nr:hypothetical protein BOTBODRAFT_169773 [Botryobasidium botryosum FD-172 SS1]
MAPTRARSPSPVPPASLPPLYKKAKHAPNLSPDVSALNFTPDLFDSSNTSRLRKEYLASEPFKHVVVSSLVQDALLRRVKDECVERLSFTEKETDIYKVHQTGDLASLSYLSQSQIEQLPSLLTLRDALYSPPFRQFLRDVTGCGPLSGTKQDMSVNSYKKGCHLLNHDDVIGTRRVSYILYLPYPIEDGWKEEWGGSLELYPTVKVPGAELPEPSALPSKIIPPAWNQFIFFEVQPNKSFHSVGEAIVGTPEDGRDRLSISGWFHSAQEDEEGYEPPTQPAEKSSREQLFAPGTDPFIPYSDSIPPPLPGTPLSDAHIAELKLYLNPVYLKTHILGGLASRFADESSVELHTFLRDELADELEAGLRERDALDGLGAKRGFIISKHDAGLGEGRWDVKGPPHKHRYCVLSPPSGDPPSTRTPEMILRELKEKLFPSDAFRAWLASVTSLLPLSQTTEVRRFRPGLDYTLATAEQSESRLDVVLDLTPGEGPEEGVEIGWESGAWGGWECYMAPHEGEEDPAVYRSSNKKAAPPLPTKAKSTNGDADMNAQADQSDEEDEDGTLLVAQPGFNRLLLVLRDEGVMHFVKYVSASAKGSRYDVCGEWQVGQVEEEDEEEA